MSVHAVRIKTSKNQESNPDTVPSPEPPELHNVIHDRVKNHLKTSFTPVLEAQDNNAELVKSTATSTFSEDHARGTYRFDGSDSLSSILDSIENNVGPDAKWYKIESHVCRHDEDKPCDGWQTERTKGTIPSGV